MKQVRRKLCLFVIFMALFAVTVPAHAMPSVNGSFPIGIYYNPGPTETTNAKYAEIADMNANFILGSNFLDTFEETDKALGYAAANGLKMIVNDGRLTYNSRQHLTQPATGSVVQLTYGNPVGQTFVSSSVYGAVSTIRLRLDPASLSSNTSITLVAYSSLSRGPVYLTDTVTGPFASQDISFDIYALSALNHTYYYEFTTDSTTPIGIMASSSDVYAGGQAYINSVAQPFDLTFDVEFSTRAYFDGQRPSDTILDEIANHYKSNSAVLGYNLIDEPSALLYAKLDETSDRLKLTDPDRLSFVNLFPNQVDPTQTLGTITNFTGVFISSALSVGQTFKTKPNEMKIDYISLYIDRTTWGNDEFLTLSLWDSPAKQTLLANKTFGGANGGTWIPFPLNANVSADTTYYWELTHNGGGDNKVGWVVRSQNGVNWFPDGTGYMNGTAINADFYYAVNQTILGKAYEDYVNRWVSLNPDVLVFDHYPFQKNGQDSKSYFENLEIIRRQALLGGIDFWPYIQSVGITNNLRPPSEAEMKYQVYTNLAYGAKGMIYFTYVTPPISGFNNGLILPGGTSNSSYTWAKNLNADVLNLGATLQNLTSQAVYHTGTLPAETKALPADFFFRPTDSTQPFVIGYFKDGTGREYVFVVNRDYANARTAAFTVEGHPGTVEEVSKATGTNEITGIVGQTGQLLIGFSAGEGKLFVLPEVH